MWLWLEIGKRNQEINELNWYSNNFFDRESSRGFLQPKMRFCSRDEANGDTSVLFTISARNIHCDKHTKPSIYICSGCGLHHIWLNNALDHSDGQLSTFHGNAQSLVPINKQSIFSRWTQWTAQHPHYPHLVEKFYCTWVKQHEFTRKFEKLLWDFPWEVSYIVSIECKHNNYILVPCLLYVCENSNLNCAWHKNVGSLLSDVYIFISILVMT